MSPENGLSTFFAETIRSSGEGFRFLFFFTRELLSFGRLRKKTALRSQITANTTGCGVVHKMPLLIVLTAYYGRVKWKSSIMPRTKVKTSVSLSKDVIDYLDGLARASERDRSWVVNALARYHAAN